MRRSSAFTIVELIVVIAVIGILATISIISYNGWRTNTVTNQLKSDLTNAAAAMERDRSFGEGYPTALPSNFNPSEGVTISYSAGDARSYCLDGVVAGTSIALYIDNQTSSSGPQEGTCSGRPVTTPPATSPTLTRGTQSNVSIAFTWTAVTGASTYNLQCSTDDAFVGGIVQNTAFTGTSGTLTGLSPSTGYFCRIKAVNSYGSSNWSSTVTGTTTALATPGSPTATAVSGKAITFSWTAVSGASHYTAQVSTSSSFSSVLYEWPSVTSTSVTKNYLSINTRYYFRVRATNAQTTLTSSWATANTYTLNEFGSLPIASSIEGYFTSAPEGYLLEQGQAVSRTTYADLFAVIGTTFGAGDGSTTFNLPDSRGRVSVNINASDSEFNTLGEEYGTKVETLTAGQLPPHQHALYAEFGTNVSLVSGPPGQYNHLTTNAAYTFRYEYTQADGGGGGSHNNIQPSIVKMSAIKYAGIDSSATELPAGTSVGGYWTSSPAGYLYENGSAVSRTTYSDLFAKIGTTYGTGDGSTTFNLPDSRGRAGVAINSADAEFNALGEQYGEKAHTLTTAEIPAHSHTVRAEYGSTANRNVGIPSTYNSISASTAYGPRYEYTRADGGSGQSHNEIQPSIVKRYVIKTGDSTTAGNQDVEPGTSISGYWSSSTPPTGYLTENGAAVSRTTYSNLFAEIGTTYGTGDGSTTFNLPDSRGRVSVNLSSSDAEFNTIGEEYGTKTHTLTTAQIPPHQHAIRAEFGSNNTLNNAPPGTYNQLTTNGAYPFQSAYMPATGGSGGSHNNIQPSIVKRTFIKF